MIHLKSGNRGVCGAEHGALGSGLPRLTITPPAVTCPRCRNRAEWRKAMAMHRTLLAKLDSLGTRTLR